MISTSPSAGVAALNSANPNQLADRLRAMGFGSFVRAMPVPLRNQNPDDAPANPYVHSTLDAITLPDDAKCAVIFSAYARTAGTGQGALPLKVAIGNASPFTTPTTGTIGISPSGDIVVLGTDEITNLDVLYLPEKYDVGELTLSVASNSLTIPAALVKQGIVLAMEIESLAGTLVSKLEVLAPGSSPATGQACLDAAKANVLFAGADAVTSARVKFGVASAIDINAFLEVAGTF